MITIDRFSYHSGLRYVNTGEKFAFSVITLVLCVGSRSVCLAVFVLLAMGILTIKKGKIPLGGYLRLLSVTVAFLGMNSLVLGTSIRQTPLEVFSVRFGTWYLTAGRETICYGIQIFVTAMAAVSCLYFLSCNTTMTDIFVLLRRWKCPVLIVELMLLIYRFIFVLLDRGQAVAAAQKSRLGNRDYRTGIHSFGQLISCLFISSVKRSEALFDAMESRCYDGEIRVLEEEYPPKRIEIFGILAFELWACFLIWIGR